MGEDAVDGDGDDHITVFNEAPPGLFSAGKEDQDKAACSMMKEKTTSGRVKCKTFQMNDETKKRENRIVVSSQIGCYMGATNDVILSFWNAAPSQAPSGMFATMSNIHPSDLGQRPLPSHRSSTTHSKSPPTPPKQHANMALHAPMPRTCA